MKNIFFAILIFLSSATHAADTAPPVAPIGPAGPATSTASPEDGDEIKKPTVDLPYKPAVDAAPKSPENTDDSYIPALPQAPPKTAPFIPSKTIETTGAPDPAF